jgi:type II secretory pathway component PulJ
MSRDEGFTYIELLFALAISLILIEAASRFFASQFRGYLLQGELLEVQQQGRIGIDFFAREVRMASTITEATTGSDPFFSSDPPVLHFYADRNGNGTFNGPDDHDEEIDYRLVPSSRYPPTVLYRRSGASGLNQPLISHVEGMMLQYLLEDGTVRPDRDHPAPYVLSDEERSDIRRISLVLRVQTEKSDLLRLGDGGHRVRTFSVTVWLRNL